MIGRCVRSGTGLRWITGIREPMRRPRRRPRRRPEGGASKSDAHTVEIMRFPKTCYSAQKHCGIMHAASASAQRSRVRQTTSNLIF